MHNLILTASKKAFFCNNLKIRAAKMEKTVWDILPLISRFLVLVSSPVSPVCKLEYRAVIFSGFMLVILRKIISVSYFSFVNSATHLQHIIVSVDHRKKNSKKLPYSDLDPKLDLSRRF